MKENYKKLIAFKKNYQEKYIVHTAIVLHNNRAEWRLEESN